MYGIDSGIKVTLPFAMDYVTLNSDVYFAYKRYKETSMAENNAIQVGDFLFEDADLAQKAIKEQKAINYLRHQLEGRNVSAVISAYHQLIHQEIFETELGFSFLSELRQQILSDPAVLEEDVNFIPIRLKVSEEQASSGQIPEEAKGQMQEPGEQLAPAQLVERTKNIVKKYRERFYMLLVVVLILLAAVVFMFVLTVSSGSPNILNYKTKLENEYASWDENLQKREEEVKKKEEELLRKAEEQEKETSDDEQQDKTDEDK